jgi:hypothetical protein
MIEVPDPWTGLLISALRDAIAHNHGLLRSETLKDRAEYEEHLLHLEQFFEYVKDEYRRQDKPGRLPLSEILGHE